MMYGNSSMGYGYSPNRSRDVDRFNPSTRSNYSTQYNTKGYGLASEHTAKQTNHKGHYDGRGVWVND